MTRSPRSTVGIAHPGALPPYEAVIFCLDAMVAGAAALDASAWTSLFHEVVADPRAADQGTRTADQAFTIRLTTASTWT